MPYKCDSLTITAFFKFPLLSEWETDEFMALMNSYANLNNSNLLLKIVIAVFTDLYSMHL